MQWPEQVPGDAAAAPPLRLGDAGRLEVARGFAAEADDRFEAVCAELGILLARRVEPVSARVLPFGTEQLAMVQVADTTSDVTHLHAATARAPTPAAAVAGAAISAMTGGGSVLASALPSAVAEGRVRSAVVFGDGDAPVRWGRADDEARLAALYAVVPHLGSFTATTGRDTYRVLRLPGIGVSLVSEGEGAATWVAGWFAALLHATQFALRTREPTATVVATTAPAAGDDALASRATVLAQLEDECRRILLVAQDQAREIRAAAERDATHPTEDFARPETRAGAERATPPRDEGGDEALVADARRTSDTLLADAERERAALLAETRREVDRLRSEAETAAATLLAETKRACRSMRKAARRDAKQARRKAARRLRKAAARAAAQQPDRRFASDVVDDARRAADDLLRDARRAADDLVRDATRLRQRALDDVAHATHVAVAAPATAVPATAAAPPVVAPPTVVTPAPSEAAQLAALALLRAAAESVAVLSTQLGRVADPPRAGDPLRDVPGLFYGA
jgi:hypothetical protein